MSLRKITSLFLILVSMALLVLAAAHIYFYGKKEVVTEHVTTAQDFCLKIENNLSLGDSDETTGGDVSRLQNFLKISGEYPYNITGLFDENTEAAVQRWQNQHGPVLVGAPDLTGFGAVEEDTRRAMSSRCSEEMFIEVISPKLYDTFGKDNSGVVDFVWFTGNVSEEVYASVQLCALRLFSDVPPNGSMTCESRNAGMVSASSTFGGYTWNLADDETIEPGDYTASVYLISCKTDECKNNKNLSRFSGDAKLKVGAGLSRIRIDESSAIGVNLYHGDSDRSPVGVTLDEKLKFTYVASSGVEECVFSKKYNEIVASSSSIEKSDVSESKVWEGGSSKKVRVDYWVPSIEAFPLTELREVTVSCRNSEGAVARDKIDVQVANNYPSIGTVRNSLKIVVNTVEHLNLEDASEIESVSHCKSAISQSADESETKVECYWGGKLFTVK